jgi:ABC-type Mn2+/Zn2+ transport system permease subunit
MSLFSEDYTRRALLEVILVGALCGAIGVHVVLRRLSFFTMAMTHATFPGIVLASLLGVNLLLGTGLFGVLLVLTVAGLWTRRGTDQTSVVGVVLSGGFALGVVLLSAQSGFTKDLSSYLVGSILTVDSNDLVVTGIVAVAVLALLVLLGKELLLAAFDPTALVAMGYSATALNILLLLAVETTVVVAVPAVGTILSVALIVAPAATARLWCERITPMMITATAVGIVSGVIGLSVSQLVDVAAGAAIVITACLIFAASFVATRLRTRWVARQRPGRRPTVEPVVAGAVHAD